MTHPNLRSADPLQPRSPDTPRRPSIPRTPPWSPPPREIITEGLKYSKYTDRTDKFEFPPDFVPGDEGTRIGNLNRALIISYGQLRDAVNSVNHAEAVLKYNKDRILISQKEDLEKDLDYCKQSVRHARTITREIIGEIDAVGGHGAFYWPPRWQKIVGVQEIEKWRRVEAGSLGYLASDEHFVKEEYVAVDPTVYDGDKGKDNLMAKRRFEGLAYALNRIGYLKACQCKGKEYKDYLASLKYQVREVIRCAGEGTLLMPDYIRHGVVRVLDEAAEEDKRLLKEKQVKRAEKEREAKKRKVPSIFEDVVSEDEFEVVKIVQVPEKIEEIPETDEEIATRAAQRREQMFKDLKDKEKNSMAEAAAEAARKEEWLARRKEESDIAIKEEEASMKRRKRREEKEREEAKREQARLKR